MRKKHWDLTTFKITEASDLGQYGFCTICNSDMQRFFSDKRLRHYKSHRYFKSLNGKGYLHSQSLKKEN